MQTVILAGGLGTRMKKLAARLPKALIPAAGRPFIEHQLELLRRNGCGDILICAGYRGKMLEKHLGDGASFGVKISYSRESPRKLLGTGGALVNAFAMLREKFMVLYGDSYLPIDYRKVVRAFEKNSAPALMCVYRNKNKWDVSNVKIRDGFVVFYSKNPGGERCDYIDYGLSIYRKSVMEAYLNAPLPLDLAQIQENLAARRQLRAHVAAERFYEIGRPSGLEDFEKYIGSARGRR
ncbi:MAG: sugar phosphate nucleotidyltransferase [Kiritimatiellae bacterium]|nr:sugar phosphate nucleotidyltransferase [Kiritimatiellia bacterium]